LDALSVRGGQQQHHIFAPLLSLPEDGVFLLSLFQYFESCPCSCFFKLDLAFDFPIAVDLARILALALAVALALSLSLVLALFLVFVLALACTTGIRKLCHRLDCLTSPSPLTSPFVSVQTHVPNMPAAGKNSRQIEAAKKKLARENKKVRQTDIQAGGD
jgi:hypothetical protein